MSARPSNARQCTERAFTLVEVMVASLVMLFAISSCIFALQRGLQALDSARNYSAAAQLMQSEMENLRLKTWAQLEELQRSRDQQFATAGARGVSAVRSIEDFSTGIKRITLTATWPAYNGQPQTVKFITFYAREGLYDYFYTAH